MEFSGVTLKFRGVTLNLDGVMVGFSCGRRELTLLKHIVILQNL